MTLYTDMPTQSKLQQTTQYQNLIVKIWPMRWMLMRQHNWRSQVINQRFQTLISSMVNFVISHYIIGLYRCNEEVYWLSLCYARVERIKYMTYGNICWQLNQILTTCKSKHKHRFSKLQRQEYIYLYWHSLMTMLFWQIYFNGEILILKTCSQILEIIKFLVEYWC